jgi:hypothetical protein
MSEAPPIRFVWQGDSFTPAAPYWQRMCDKHYVIGNSYDLVPHEDRSTKSHNHEFAWLNEAHANLPENLAEQYPTPDHLRKRALIEAGYYDEQVIDAGTNAAALRIAVGVRSFPGESFSLVTVRNGFVIIRRPRSQSRRAMNAKEFQESKTKIMEIVAEMIGTTPAELSRSEAA